MAEVGAAEEQNVPLSPIDSSKLLGFLSSYADRHFIISGFREGFRLSFKGSLTSTDGRNSSSVRLNFKEALKKVSAERALGRLAGPFKDKPFSPFKCSPLSLRPKSTPGKFRLLHDLSFPYDAHSVNAGIGDEDAKVQYASVKDAIEILLGSEQAFMAKADIKDAYRQVPLARDQYWLVGFKLQGLFYHDLRLPMGARSSCAIFERVASALEFILRDRYKVKHVIKMLDDFMFIGESETECGYALWAFKDLCSQLNIPLADEKTVNPSREVVFLGILLNSRSQFAALPRDKAQRYAQLAQRLARQKTITLGDLREITGKLEHATCIIRGGRAFLRRLHNAKRGVQRAARRITVSASMSADLELWAQFLLSFNTRTLFTMVLNPKVGPFTLGSDASKGGYGGYWGRRCITGRFPMSWQRLDIQVLELYPILVLVGINASDMKDSVIRVRCDNQALVHCLNNLTSKNSSVMKLMRILVLYLLSNNISLVAEYISSKDNWLCDTLSREQVSRQWLRNNALEETFQTIPPSLRPEALGNVSMK